MKHIVCILFLVSALHASADSWALPTAQTVVSEKGHYIAKIIPADFKSKSPDKHAIARIYKYDEQSDTYIKYREQDLVNKMMPVYTLILDNSQIITFDEWHSVGIGKNVIVVYGENGKFLKNFPLDRIAYKFEIKKFKRSVSSIYWRGNAHYVEYRHSVFIDPYDKEAYNGYELHLKSLKINPR